MATSETKKVPKSAKKVSRIRNGLKTSFATICGCGTGIPSSPFRQGEFMETREDELR